jgi:hypothetical protein
MRTLISDAVKRPVEEAASKTSFIMSSADFNPHNIFRTINNKMWHRNSVLVVE